MFRIIQASGRNIDFIRAFVVLVSQRSTARVAKGAIRAGVRPIPLRLSFFEGELREPHRDPRHRLGAGGPAAIRAMTICLIQRWTARPETRFAAITTAGETHSLHPMERLAPNLFWA